MRLIIDIPEDVYTRLFDNGIQDNEIAVDDVCEMARSLRRGIPLPKGHKVVDATLLQEQLALVPMDDRTFRKTVEIIDWFPSII